MNKNLIQIFSPKFSSKWPYYVLIIIATIGISFLFLRETPQEVPMGDSYIHFLYARNLALNGELAYNHGSKEGIGTSSLLWVLILSLFQKMGISPVIMSQKLGIGFLILCGFLVFELALIFFRDKLKPGNLLRCTAISIIGLLSGSMVWIALSGMETILFLTLGLLSLWLYSRESWVLLGISLGFLTLTRIEGISLAGLLVLVEFLRSKRINHALVKIIVPLVFIITPWLIFLQIE